MRGMQFATRNRVLFEGGCEFLNCRRRTRDDTLFGTVDNRERKVRGMESASGLAETESIEPRGISSMSRPRRALM